MSNVLGTITPVRWLSDLAHAHGAIAIVDACQFVPHVPTDVQAMGADFVAFSAHKMCGPSGIGVLWGREALLEAMPPLLGGGHMISDVRLDGYTPAELPAKFESGTPPIAEAVGLGAAVDYLSELGMANVRAHEMAVTATAITRLREAYGDDVTIYGPTNVELRGGAVSFAFRDLHPHDISQVLDQSNVCVRAGHHCAKPLMRVLGTGATARASFYIYNDVDDVDALVDGLGAAADFFAL
jgi:cysteine desulfurase/selenocysteine lyase